MNPERGESWALELEGLAKSYRSGLMGPRFDALHPLTLRLDRGQVLGLLGPNGSGKSTTLKLLAGLIAPTAGEGRIFGQRIGSDEARAKVGYLPESPQFPTHLSGRGFLSYCAGLSGLPESVARRRIEESMYWSGLGGAEDRKIGTYSKGMSQRLGLAQVVLHEPELVLLDEPSSGLDPEGRIALDALIRELAKGGTTVVFSSHLLTQAGALCDRIAILGRGRLLVEGSAEEIAGTDRSEQVQPSPLEKVYLEKLNAHG
jgi:ABC-type multidrug transport system ATPase subunit